MEKILKNLHELYGKLDVSDFNQHPLRRDKKFNIPYIASALLNDKGTKNDSNRKRNKISK